jgi:hypothetical protein
MFGVVIEESRTEVTALYDVSSGACFCETEHKSAYRRHSNCSYFTQTNRVGGAAYKGWSHMAPIPCRATQEAKYDLSASNKEI